LGKDFCSPALLYFARHEVGSDAARRALPLGGIAARRADNLPAGRSKVGVGILFKIGSNFVQKAPPTLILMFSRVLALPSLCLGSEKLRKEAIEKAKNLLNL